MSTKMNTYRLQSNFYPSVCIGCEKNQHTLKNTERKVVSREGGIILSMVYNIGDNQEKMEIFSSSPSLEIAHHLTQLGLTKAPSTDKLLELQARCSPFVATGDVGFAKLVERAIIIEDAQVVRSASHVQIEP